MTDELLAGRCLCGDLVFDVAPPAPWCAHCHCSICQRAHGATFVTWVGVREDRFHLRQAETLNRYRLSERANFEGAIDREPSGHLFWQCHVDWVELEDELPQRPA